MTTATPKTRHHAQSQLNVDIVQHVTQYGPCGFIELFDLFGMDQDGGKNPSERFRCRLGHLTTSGQLLATGNAGARRWRIPQVGTEAAQAWVGTTAAPAQYDRMRAPAYKPDAGPAQRAGAQDFQSVASIGQRC